MASNTIKKEYITAKGENKYLKVELYYSLGGINYFTYKTERRGYYLSVCPVERSRCGSGWMESYAAFTGSKILVQECARKSRAAEQKALGQYDNMKAMLMDKFKSLLPDNQEVA